MARTRSGCQSPCVKGHVLLFFDLKTVFFCDFGILLDEVEAVQNPAYEIAGVPRYFCNLHANSASVPFFFCVVCRCFVLSVSRGIISANFRSIFFLSWKFVFCYRCGIVVIRGCSGVRGVFAFCRVALSRCWEDSNEWSHIHSPELEGRTWSFTSQNGITMHQNRGLWNCCAAIARISKDLAENWAAGEDVPEIPSIAHTTSGHSKILFVGGQWQRRSALDPWAAPAAISPWEKYCLWDQIFYSSFPFFSCSSLECRSALPKCQRRIVCQWGSHGTTVGTCLWAGLCRVGVR